MGRTKWQGQGMGEGRKDDPKVPNLHGSDTKMSLLDVPSNYQARVRSTCFRSKPSIFDSKSLHISTLKTSLERVGCAYKKNHPGCWQYFQIQKRGRHNDQSRPCHPPSDSGLSMLPSALTCHWRVSCKPLSLGWVYSVWNLKFNPSIHGANPGIHQKARHNPVLCLMMVDDGWWWLMICLASILLIDHANPQMLCLGMKGRRQLATCQLKTESPPQKSWWKHLWQDTDQNPLKHQVNHCKKHHEENQQASNSLHGRLHWGLTKALAGK